MTETPPLAADDSAAVRRLTRAREGRWFAGVCAGLGRYFDLSPVVYRLVFAALALAGGTGILLYLAAWLVMPDEGEEASIAEQALREHRDRPGLAVGLGLLVLAGVVTLSHAPFWPHPGNLWLAALVLGAGLVWWDLRGRDRGGARAASADQPPPRARRTSLAGPVLGILLAAAGVLGLLAVLDVPLFDIRIALAGALVFVGVATAAAALTGRAVGGLVGLGLVLGAALAISLALHVPFRGPVGEQLFAPATSIQLERAYRGAIGQLRIDLSGTDLAEGVTHVNGTLGVGELVVTVPGDVNVDVTARANAGELRLLGRRADGINARQTVRDEVAGATRTVVLDLRVGLGEVRVERE